MPKSTAEKPYTGKSNNGKATNRRNLRLVEDLKAAEADTAARAQGPARKKWSHRDMQPLVGKTENQKLAMSHWKGECDVLGLFGSAGTGKTYLAVQLAFREALERKLKIRLVRSTVQTREQGFLKGTLEDKEAPFKEVYEEAIGTVFGRDATYGDMVAAKLITFHSTSFLRGRNFHDSIILVDECQNMTFEELNTVITRMGENSRLILMGDTVQNDIGKYSGLKKMLEMFSHLDGRLQQVKFLPADCVRNDWLKHYLEVVYTHS